MSIYSVSHTRSSVKPSLQSMSIFFCVACCPIFQEYDVYDVLSVGLNV